MSEGPKHGPDLKAPRERIPKAHLPVATHEAARTSRLLSAATGRDVFAQPILALAVDALEISQPPDGVAILRVAGLRKWLVRQPVLLSVSDITTIAAAANKPSTWIRAPKLVCEARGVDGCVCGGTLVVRTRRSDGHQFLGCSAYPRCKRTHNTSE